MDIMKSNPAKPLTGRTVLICLIAFFAVVIGMNGLMAKLAIDTLPGTDVDSAYKASLAYNAEIRAAEEQSTRGWRVAAHVERGVDGQASVKVEARDADNVPLAGLTFSARMFRPADNRSDRLVGLSERAAGLYDGKVGDVEPGQWELVIEATGGAKRLFLSRNRIILQ